LASEQSAGRIPIESAVAHIDTSRVVARLGALQAITDPSLSQLGIATLTREMLKRVCDALSVEGASLHLLPEGEDELLLAATEGPRRADRPSERVALRTGIVGRVAATGRPIVVEDQVADPSLPLAASQELGSVASVPLRLQGRVTGVLSVATAISRAFDESEVALLSIAADRLASAIDRVRLAEAECRARAIAADALRVRDDFLSMLSHELKTPMTSLVLLVQLLLRSSVNESTEPDVDRSLRSIERQVLRLADLTETLLDVARMNASGAGLTLDSIDLGAVARIAVARAAEASSQSGASVSIRADAPIVGLWDGKRCEQMLMHLLANASGYTREGPIEIDLMADSENARIIFRDGAAWYGHGPGVSLWVVQRIAEALGGRMSVADAPGRGSPVVIELPLRGPPEKV
jgi:K+-sensing histidine kinase KdpD